MSSAARDAANLTFAGQLLALEESAHAPSETISGPRGAAATPELWHGSAAAWQEVTLLGKGGMGTVHAAHDRVLDRVVALKRPLLSADAPALVVEARTLARLDHPNVVPVHALARSEEGLPVVVMKRVDGRRWSDLLREGRDLARDLDIALEVADALRFAHARKIFHRDIKPDNVMVGPFGEVYLMDWGCAASGDNVVTTMVLGTPAYLAPEMLRPGATVGPATDIFLLGATLHRAVTGEVRHHGRDLREVLEKARKATPAEYPADVPTALGRLLNRACALDPADRFASVEEFAAALREFRSHRDAASLADEALARAGELDARIAAGGEGATATWDELRGQLRAALRVWPGNERAREGLDELAERYARWCFDKGELGLAEGAAEGMLPARRATWQARIAAARKEVEARAAAAHAHDLNVASRDRLVAISIVLVGAVVSGVALRLLVGADGFDAAELIYVAAFSTALILLAMAATWRGLRRSPASMKLLTAVVAMSLGEVVWRSVAWYVGLAPAVTLLAEMVWFWCLLCVVGLLSEAGLAFAGLPFLAGAVGVALRPGLADELFPACVGLATVVSVVVTRRRAVRAAGG